MWQPIYPHISVFQASFFAAYIFSSVINGVQCSQLDSYLDISHYTSYAAKVQPFPIPDELFPSKVRNDAKILYPRRENIVILEDNEAESLISFSFNPERGKNISDYKIEIQSSEENILSRSDVEVSPPIIFNGNSANFSASVLFQKQVGVVSLEVFFQERDVEGTIYARLSVKFIVCGISFFSISKKGEEVFLRNNTLSVQSEVWNVEESRKWLSSTIQFPDGSTSTVWKVVSGSHPSFNDIYVEVNGTEMLDPSYEHSCLLKDSITSRDVGNQAQGSPEKCSFGFSKQTPIGSYNFFVALSTQKQGKISFRFLWPSFLQNTELGGDVYETTLEIVILPSISPAVMSISPTGPFKKSGGDLITFTISNSEETDDFFLHLGDIRLLPLIFRYFADRRAEVVFLTPPGEGKDIPWNLVLERKELGTSYTCPWAGLGSRFNFSYKVNDLKIYEISPDSGPMAGGIEISISGGFGDFQKSRDGVMLGSYTLKPSEIIEANQSTIKFVLPSFDRSNQPDSIILIRILVNGHFSNSVEFFFETLADVKIEAQGASFISDNRSFVLPICPNFRNVSSEGSSLILSSTLNQEVLLSNLSFKWKMEEVVSGQIITPLSGNTENRMMIIPIEKLVANGIYKVTVVVQDLARNTRASDTTLVKVVPSVGLSVTVRPDIMERTMAAHSPSMRLTASVARIGACSHGLTADQISIEWKFNGSTKTLSHEDETTDLMTASPRRLGREYIIPVGNLSYGRHLVEARAFFTLTPAVEGSAFSHFDIKPSLLHAIIGKGERKISVSRSDEYSITADRSFDPDEAGNSTMGLRYLWSCKIVIPSQKSSTQTMNCPTELFPANSSELSHFIVSSDHMGHLGMKRESLLVEYSLTVTKNFMRDGVIQVRSSVTALQIVEITAEKNDFENDSFVELTTSNFEQVNAREARYFEDIFIRPYSKTAIYWTYSVIRPEPNKDDEAFFENPNNFFQQIETQNPFTAANQKNHLGIKSFVLLPDTEYEFKIRFNYQSGQYHDTVVTLYTTGSPNATISSLYPDNGTTKTPFTAVAKYSIHDENYKYIYNIELSNGTVMCIDGCSGSPIINFRLPIPGRHRMKLFMTNKNGNKIVSSLSDEKWISITEGDEDDFSEDAFGEIMAHSTSRHNFEREGDHSAFLFSTFRFSRLVSTLLPSVSESTFNLVVLEISDILNRLSILFEKTTPNTACGRDYLTITKMYSSLVEDNPFLLQEEGLLSLCAMISHTVRNTDENDEFELLDNLRTSISHITAAARQISSQGSSRRRRISSPNGVNTIVLQIGEIVVPTWGTVRLRETSCGSVWSEDVGDGFVRISAGSFCKSGDGNKLFGHNSTLQWCNSLYENFVPGFPMKMMLGEFREDYVGISGVLTLRENETLLIQNMENEDSVVDTLSMPSHSKSIIRAKYLGNPRMNPFLSGCVKLQQELVEEEKVFNNWDGDVSCEGAVGIQYMSRKTLNGSIGRNSYSQEALESTVLSNVGEQNRTIVSDATSEGLYGLKWESCIFYPALIIGVVTGSWFAVTLTLVVIVLLIFGTGGWSHYILRTSIVGIVEDPNDAYIARDTYGRDAYGREVFIAEEEPSSDHSVLDGDTEVEDNTTEDDRVEGNNIT